jgi:hypothetical protein
MNKGKRTVNQSIDREADWEVKRQRQGQREGVGWAPFILLMDQLHLVVAIS